MLDIPYLNALRRLEMEEIVPHLPAGSHILEFGAGTGEQARFLAEQGFKVTAIDLASSNYAQERLFPVQDYDGRHLPLGDASVDVIFSSNVLEHVDNFEEISAEFRRVLKAGGFAIHVMPTAAWRFWTFLSGGAEALKAAAELSANLVSPPAGTRRLRSARTHIGRIANGLLPRGHGTSREGLSELWTFSRHAWRRKFKKSGFEIVQDSPMKLFYTGYMVFGDAMPISARQALSRLLGSACRIYRVRPM